MLILTQYACVATTRALSHHVVALLALALPVAASAVGDASYVSSEAGSDRFPLVVDDTATRLWVDRDDFVGVVRAAGDLREDIERVTGLAPVVWTSGTSRDRRLVIIGTLGRSELVDRQVAAGRIDAPSLEYRLYRFSTGEATVRLTVAPTLNFMPDRGLRVAVSFDDEAPQILTLVPQGYDAANGNPTK